MNFVIERDDLLNGLSLASKAITTKGTMPILSCILLSANDNGIKITANNLDLCIETAIIDAQVLVPGYIALDARLFGEIAKKLPDDYVTIQVDSKNVCTIKSGKSEFKVSGLDGSEFPSLPVVTKGSEYIFKQTDIRNMIKGTVFSVAWDETKPALTGELFQIKDGALAVVAVDGYRVSLRKLAVENTAQDISFIIPGKTAGELMKIFTGGTNDSVRFYFSKNQILFETDNCMVVSRLLQGNFINYEPIIQICPQMSFQVDRQKLLGSIERIALISNEDKKIPVKFSVADNSITISSSTSSGAAHDEVEGVMRGNPLEIAFNSKYLSDALKAIEDDEVLLNFTGSEKPCVINSAHGRTDYTYLIVPLRLKESA